MKKKMTLALAGLIYALTLSAIPHHAAASTTSAAPPPDSQLVRASGDKPVKYMAVELAAEILVALVV
jgi:hypothetical protein